MLKQPRLALFPVYWYVTIFLLAYVVAWLYSSVRATRGAGPGTAVTVGLLVGFAAGFPMNLSLVAWAPMGRYLPLWWMLDLWLGAIFASLVAGWLYKEAS
jgi:mannitol-specific phosphotransferase system IIBC component